MNILRWYLSLTDHELNALGTAFAMLASVSSILGIWTARWARLAWHNARDTKDQTRRVETIDGKEHIVTVSQDAHHASHETSDLRAELSPLRLHGRRRNTPTNPVPTERNPQ